MTGRIEIPFNRSKIIWMSLGSLLFVMAGIWFVFWTPTSDNVLFKEPVFVKAIGVLSIVFFGYTLFLSLQKLKDKTPALVIDDTGIMDNTSGLSIGHIPWTDIVEIRSRRAFNQKFLMVILKNPQDYLAKQPSTVKKKLMQQNLKFYGSPISISANLLQTGFVHLEALLTKKFAERKQL